jgi:hypothetical protein
MQTLAHNEKTKLTATFINNIAVGQFLAFGVALGAAHVSSVWTYFAVLVPAIGVAALMHLSARHWPRDLKD